jgi:hypothetical protein
MRALILSLLDQLENIMKRPQTCWLLLLLLLLCAAGHSVAAQDPNSPLVVIKFSWEKERIRPTPSMATLASQDELIQQSRREQQLQTARNAQQKGASSRLETQMGNHQDAKVKAQQTELPRDGYRYKVSLRNEGVKIVKSIDWDYYFVDPNTNQELARHQFTSDETIKPGKSKEVSVLYLKPPVKTVGAQSLGKKETGLLTAQVVIVRLQFSDGSVWQRP